MRAVLRVRQAIANLSLRRYGFETRPVEMLVVVDSALLGLIPLEYVVFPPVNIILPTLPIDSFICHFI